MNVLEKKYTVQSLDITDYCGVSDLEAISEDGLTFVIKEVLKKVANGWEFVDCVRDTTRPGKLQVYFAKGEQ